MNAFKIQNVLLAKSYKNAVLGTVSFALISFC